MNFINKMTKDSGEHKTNNIINIIKGSAISIFFSIVALIIFPSILFKLRYPLIFTIPNFGNLILLISLYISILR